MPKSFASRPVKRLVAAALALAVLAGPAAAQYIQTGPTNPAYSPLNPLTPAQRNQLILQGRNAELQANQRVQQASSTSKTSRSTASWTVPRHNRSTASSTVLSRSPGSIRKCRG